MNIENHMVLNTPDAPWNAPDATGTCDECHEAAATAAVKDRGIERDLCQSCDDARMTKINHAAWTDALRGARVGDVVVTLDNNGFRHILSVERVDMTSLSGSSCLAEKDGKIFSLSVGIGCCTYDFKGVADLQVVSL